MSTEERLINETKKWMEKAKKRRNSIEIKERKDLVENIDAYMADCDYFLEEGKYVEAFEAIVWAWSWLEILEELKIIRRV